MAITVGVFLVVPMLIMTLWVQSQNKSLVTVLVVVFWLVIPLAFGIRLSNAEMPVPTATYAAVLVVFVGTSSNGVKLLALTGGGSKGVCCRCNARRSQ